ncbi:MAG: efflux RND transporter permease subunit [Prevotella sp.]|nr:efflux RND transporter permease subunit [Prevotella sp.]
MKLTEFFLKRPTLFWSLMVAILLAGIISFNQMPKLEDPAIPIKQCNVVVVYPGATAHEVELQVAQTMEDQLRTLPNIKRIKSDCTPGICQLTVEFKETVLMDQIEQHFDQLRRKVNDIRSSLPQGCYDPIVIDDMMDVYGMFYALTSDGYDYPEMLRYAKKLRREILTVKGVKRVIIAGDRKEVINITLSKDKISRNGLLPTQIMAILQDASKTIDGSKYDVDDLRLSVRLSGRVKDENDVKNLLVKTIDGKIFRIGDIADVERDYQEPQTYGFFMDGKPAIALCISMDNDVIVPDVGKAVDKKINQTTAEFPVGLGMQKVFFQPDKVDEAISSFMINLLESVLIVIIALIFTMGFRSGLIIGAGLVLTIAGSFPILLMCGTTLQRISLGAFIVAMGMLVDNAIVVIDGILVDRQKGFGPKTYLTRICKATAMPLLGATIIAASAFLCIFLSPDTSGEYSRDLFLVLFVSLLVSWVLALTQVPMFTKYLMPLHVSAQNGGVEEKKMQRVTRSIITKLIEWKKTTVVVAILTLVLSGMLMGNVKNLFFPDFSYKQFVVEYFAPDQTSPDQIRKDLLHMSEVVGKNPNVTSVAASMGSAPAHYCLVRPMTAGGDCYGELVIDCPDYETVCEELPKIRKQLREMYPDGYIRARKYNFSIQTSHTVEVAFSGPDPEVLKKLAHQAEDIMRRCKYVDPQSVQNDWRPMGKSVDIKYAEMDARRAGVNRADIGNAFQAVSNGMTCGVINDQDNQVLINFRVRNADGSRIQDISDIPAWAQMNINTDAIDLATAMMGGKGMSDMMDKMVKAAPLSSVTCDNNMGWEEQLIRRVDGQRHIEAECDPDFEQSDATPNKVMQTIMDDINKIQLPEGYTMRWIGEQEAQSSSNDNLIKYSPLTMFIILGIMLLLFGRWKKVILILMCFPFVLCGIAPALFLTGSPFTFMAIIGFMGLMGMMVKNGIVLVDEITRLTNEGQHPYNAVVNATVSRTRPVIMASLTTILGMLPLITDPMYSAMAVTIMSGLAMGTVITLALLPLFYTAFYHISKSEIS